MFLVAGVGITLLAFFNRKIAAVQQTPTGQTVDYLLGGQGFIPDALQSTLADLPFSPVPSPAKQLPGAMPPLSSSAPPSLADRIAAETSKILNVAASTSNLATYRGVYAPLKSRWDIEQAVATGALPWGQFGVYTPSQAVGYLNPQPRKTVTLTQSTPRYSRVTTRDSSRSVASPRESSSITTQGSTSNIYGSSNTGSATIFATRYAPGYTPGVGWSR